MKFRGLIKRPELNGKVGRGEGWIGDRVICSRPKSTNSNSCLEITLGHVFQRWSNMGCVSLIIGGLVIFGVYFD